MKEKNQDLKIGQFRKSSLINAHFMNLLSFSQTETRTPVPGASDYEASEGFLDRAIFLGTGEEKKNFEINTNYYLNFAVKKITSNQKISIFLKKEEKNGKDKKQFLKTIEIEAGEGEENFNFIFTPNNNDFNLISFELKRVYSLDGEGNSSRIVNFNNFEIYQLTNIIKEIFNGSKGVLLKIGIQGPIGLVMCINNEEIQIGRTGVYEMARDIGVESLGFVIYPEEENINENLYDPKFFIVDYQY